MPSLDALKLIVNECAVPLRANLSDIEHGRIEAAFTVVSMHVNQWPVLMSDLLVKPISNHI